MIVKIKENLKELLITFVYAKCYYIDHRRLWSMLKDANNHNIPWVVTGDFNIIRHDEKRKRVD